MITGSRRRARGQGSLEHLLGVALAGAVLAGFAALGAGMAVAIAGDVGGVTPRSSSAAAVSAEAGAFRSLQRAAAGLYERAIPDRGAPAVRHRAAVEGAIAALERGHYTRSEFIEVFGGSDYGAHLLDLLTEVARARDRGVFTLGDGVPFARAVAVGRGSSLLRLEATRWGKTERWADWVDPLAGGGRSARADDSRGLTERLALPVRAEARADTSRQLEARVNHRALEAPALEDAQSGYRTTFVEPAAEARTERTTNLGFSRHPRARGGARDLAAQYAADPDQVFATLSPDLRGYLEGEVLPLLRSLVPDGAGGVRRVMSVEDEAEIVGAIVIGDVERVDLLLDGVAAELGWHRVPHDVASVAETAVRGVEARALGPREPLNSAEVDAWVHAEQVETLRQRPGGGALVAELFDRLADLDWQRAPGRSAVMERRFFERWIAAAATGDVETSERLAVLSAWMFERAPRGFAEEVHLVAHRMAGGEGPAPRLFVNAHNRRSATVLHATRGLYDALPEGRQVPQRVRVNPNDFAWQGEERLAEFERLASAEMQSILAPATELARAFEAGEPGLEDVARLLPGGLGRGDVPFVRDLMTEFQRLVHRGVLEPQEIPARGGTAPVASRWLAGLALYLDDVEGTWEVLAPAPLMVNGLDDVRIFAEGLVARLRSRAYDLSGNGVADEWDEAAAFAWPRREERELGRLFTMIGGVARPDGGGAAFEALYRRAPEAAFDGLSAGTRVYLETEVLPVLGARGAGGERVLDEAEFERLLVRIVDGDVEGVEDTLDAVARRRGEPLPFDLAEAAAFAAEAFGAGI